MTGTKRGKGVGGAGGDGVGGKGTLGSRPIRTISSSIGRDSVERFSTKREVEEIIVGLSGSVLTREKNVVGMDERAEV